ncbi:MAG TPA: prepilin peptidase [Bryobacteraceae bacterium]|nr:prepilin peptidase [Bryobacteraceae bacterium]
MTPILCLAFLAGLLFGSFLNVCIYRIPRDLSIVAPRSFCPECGKQLSWWQNLPLLSYLLLRGRCRQCRERISWRYPLVELVTGGLFLLIAKEFGLAPKALKWVVFESLLLILFWTDAEERILPDEVIIFGSAAALACCFFIPLPGLMGTLIAPKESVVVQSIVNALAGAALLAIPIWLIGALYGRLRRREALGLGDVKLLAMIGLFLGLEHGLLAITIGTVAGALFGVFYVAITKKDVASYELPFGSFLCVGAALLPLIFTWSRGALAVP